MKTIIVSAILGMLALPVAAQHRHGPMPHHGPYGYRWAPNWGWVAPAVIGGAVVYGLTRPDPVVVQQPIYVQQPQQFGQSQVVMIAGIAYTKQVMVINGVAQEVLIRQ